MSITLITGIPGSGKTLYALPFIKSLSEKETPPRVVYYHGINGINNEVLPWLDINMGVDLNPEVDRQWEEEKETEAREKKQSYKSWFGGEYHEVASGPKDWWKLPVGSVVVIDECQEIFPLRGSGAVVPDFVLRLAKHRHRGLDFVIITQHPMLIDQFVRRLVDRHFHVVRNFGLPKSTIHEFTSGVRETPDKSRKDSIKHEFFYPKNVYGWYTSAEKHTIRARIPLRVLLIPVALLVIGVAIYASVFLLQSMDKSKTAKSIAPSSASSAPLASGSALLSAETSRLAWLTDRVPRVRDLPFSAPVYDKVTEATEAPFPAACVEIRGGCQCYSQQATILDMSAGICREIVKKGFFVAWKTEPEDRQLVDRSDSSSRQASDPSLSGGSFGISSPDRLALSGGSSGSKK